MKLKKKNHSLPFLDSFPVVFPWPNRNLTGYVTKEARVPLHQGRVQRGEWCFCSQEWERGDREGASPTNTKKQRRGPKGNPLAQGRDLSQWHQEVGHLAMVFSPVLLFGFARTTKALRSDWLTRGRGAKHFQLPLHTLTERDKNSKLS